MTRALVVALLATPLLILAACRGAGYPVVRLEVDGATTRVRCASMSVTVHQARIVK